MSNVACDWSTQWSYDADAAFYGKYIVSDMLEFKSTLEWGLTYPKFSFGELYCPLYVWISFTAQLKLRRKTKFPLVSPKMYLAK